MVNSRGLAVAVCVLLTGCTPLSSGETPAAPAPPASSSPAPSPSPSISPTASPLPDSALPIDWRVEGSLLHGDAESVVEELHRVAGHLPVLKIDITAEQATLSALLPDQGVISFQWRDNQINRVDSDIQYLKQTTFDPADFPLSSLGRLFDIADLRGVRGELVLQIVEHRPGQVVMTVTSRPETGTVFFRKDGTAVATLGFTSVSDITAGVSEVVGDAREAFTVGFSSARGYWADLPDSEPGVVVNHSRVGGLPMFETRRSETPVVAAFDPALIEPAGLAKAIARAQGDETPECAVTIDLSLERSAPVAKIDCAGSISYSDMAGRDMTDLIES